MKTFFEILFQWKGVRIEKYRKELDPKPLDIEVKRRSIFNFHFENNSTYHSWVGSKRIESWNNVPIIRKQQFQDGIQDWIAQPYRGKKLFQNSTSGSSGVPLRFSKDWECHARTWALIEKRYAEHGIDVFRDLEARFYGIPLSNKLAYLKERTKDWIANRMRFPVFDLSDRVLEKYYHRFQQKKFVYLNGYTSSLVAYANFIIRREYPTLKDICPTLKVCITTSEMCSEQDRQTMERAFGVKVINEYGAAELDIIAFEDCDGDWVMNEQNLYVEVVDENNQPVSEGQEGKILVTALYNKAMPFIRYELGDRGVISTRRKNGYRLLEKLTGRTNDIAILPSGKVVPGLTFYYVTKSLLQQEGLIREIVVRQHAIDSFEVIYVASRELNEKEKSEVKNLLDTYMEPGLDLQITRVEQIQRQKSGKLKQFESLIR